MLVLSRKKGQQTIIDGSICVEILAIEGNRVKLGFEGPRSVAIQRAEILDESPSAGRTRTLENRAKD